MCCVQNHTFYVDEKVTGSLQTAHECTKLYGVEDAILTQPSSDVTVTSYNHTNVV